MPLAARRHYDRQMPPPRCHLALQRGPIVIDGMMVAEMRGEGPTLEHASRPLNAGQSPVLPSG